MKLEKIVSLVFIGIMLLVFNVRSYSFSPAQDNGRYQLANGGRGSGRRGSDDSHSGHFRRHHGHKHRFFFERKIYYPPFRQYYYFYDYYPEKRYYYPQDKTGLEYNPNYIPVTVIVDMVGQGIPDAVIISEIERTRSVYYLSSEVITYLKDHKVSDALIDYMLKTGEFENGY